MTLSPTPCLRLALALLLAPAVLRAQTAASTSGTSKTSQVQVSDASGKATGSSAATLDASGDLQVRSTHITATQTTDVMDSATFGAQWSLTHVKDLADPNRLASLVHNNSFIYLDHGGQQSISGPNNVSAHSVWLQSNTDAQVGGVFALTCRHYGKGDCVGYEADIFGTGAPVGYSEGVEMFRTNAQYHADNWGFTIGTLAANPATGEATILGTRQADGVTPIPLAGHNLQAQAENALAIDISKTYGAGNVQSISTVPAGVLPAAATGNYVYLVGDRASQWSAHYGQSAITTLTSAAGAAGPGAGVNRFAAGAIPVDLQVASTSGFRAGQQITISDNEDTFEMPVLVSLDRAANTLHVYLSKPHPAGSLVTTGGGVGYALNMAADNVPVGQWPVVDEGSNASVYRLAFPIVATLPGDVLLLDTFGFNQGHEIGTRAFAGTETAAPPKLTPEIAGGHLTVLHGAGGTRSWTLPRGTSWAGGIREPAPAVVFSGGGCSTSPEAHLETTRSDSEWSPVIDNPGAGCGPGLHANTELRVTNPYEIHPAAWIRSNSNPGWPGACPLPVSNRGTSTCNYRNPEVQPDPGQILTASTSGYVLVDSASPEIAVGDALEGVWDMHQYLNSNMGYRRQSYDTGTYGGGIENRHFRNIGSGTAFDYVQNESPDRDLYGLASTHFTFDAGTVATPPYAKVIDGAVGKAFVLHEPPRLSMGVEGTLLEVGCSSDKADPNLPCAHGVPDHYLVWSHANGPQNVYDSLDFDAARDSVLFRSNRGTNGLMNLGANLNRGSVTDVAVDAAPIGQHSPAPGSFTTLTVAPGAPASSSAACTPGQIKADTNYIFVCTGPNTWKRAALSKF